MHIYNLVQLWFKRIKLFYKVFLQFMIIISSSSILEDIHSHVDRCLFSIRLNAEFGKGYAWNPKYVTIETGDSIEWQWWYPTWVKTMRPRIEQATTSSSFEYNEGGFRSSLIGSHSGKT